MANSSWMCVDYRECPRGFSIGLFYSLTKSDSQPYAIALYLDRSPYWVYQNLNRQDALTAMEDLEFLEGPRGESSWRAVLSRMEVKSSTEINCRQLK